jgi:hypothetical protein
MVRSYGLDLGWFFEASILRQAPSKRELRSAKLRYAARALRGKGA